MIKMELKTGRLFLRELKEEDLPELVRLVDNINVSRFLALVVNPYTEEDGKWFINHCKEESEKDPRENYEMVIEFEGKLVGIVSITKIDHFDETGSIGYWLGEEYWRNGIMFEAASEMLRFAFEDLKLRRMNCTAFIQNEGSNHLIKKLGFEFEGVRKENIKAKSTGKVHDSNIYGLLM